MSIIELKRRGKLRKKPTLHAEAHKTIRSLIITLTVMIIALSVAFLLVTNNSAQQGYTLNQEKLKNEHLKTINSNLSTKITKSTAFSELDDNEKFDSMDEADNKIFITPEDNAIK